MAEKKITISARLLNEIREMSSFRVTFMSLILCGTVLSLVWPTYLRPQYAEVKELKLKVPQPQMLVLSQQVIRGLEDGQLKAEEELKEKRKEVVAFAESKGISLSADVYVNAVGKLNHLIGAKGLLLVKYDEIDIGRRIAEGRAKSAGKEEWLDGFVGEFSQSYTIRGSFPQAYELLQELNRFPFLCRVTEASLTSDPSEGVEEGPAKKIVTLDFTVTFSYLRAPDDGN